MNRNSTRFAAAIVLAASVQAAPAADSWQCVTIGVGAAPALAQTTAGYLERARRVYPSQLLGLVSASGHLYLLNANDGGWSERVRQGLMELRLAEPDITAARRFHVTASGVVPVDPPAGDYVCLASGRAERHGLAFTGRGEVHLAPGKSVHLVDPREGSIRVEVRAVGSEALDFREILALSRRSSIYAGLAARRPQAEAGAAREPAVPMAVAIGPVGRPDGEVIVTPRSADVPAQVEGKDPVVAAAPALGAEQSPAFVAKPERLPAKPTQPEDAPETVMAASQPVLPSPAPWAPPPSGQSYGDYASAMKKLLALRRVGGVRSLSEVTYVLPEVEYLRAQRQ